MNNVRPYNECFSKANSLFKQENYKDTILELKQFLTNEDLQIVEDCNALISLSYFRLKDYNSAIKHSQIACKTSKYFTDWFNLAMSYTLIRDISNAKDAFDKCLKYLKKSKSRRHSPSLRYYFLRTLMEAKEYNTAFEQADILKDCFMTLGYTDDHLLAMQGMPFFMQYCESLFELFPNITLDIDVVTWFKEFKNKIDTEGQEILRELEQKILDSKSTCDI